MKGRKKRKVFKKNKKKFPFELQRKSVRVTPVSLRISISNGVSVSHQRRTSKVGFRMCGSDSGFVCGEKRKCIDLIQMGHK